MKKLLISFGLATLILPTLASLPAVASAQAGAATCPNLTRDLERGMEGSDVRELQQFLVETGFLSQADMDTGPGIFGGRTETAVKLFQGAHEVPMTGYVGPLTRAAIVRSCDQTETPSVDNMPCTAPWGVRVAHGENVTAYQMQTAHDYCRSETRICNNGTLSGSYQYGSCVATQCFWNGQVVDDNDFVVAYNAASVPAGSHCSVEFRVCQRGMLSGSYLFASCVVQSGTTPIIFIGDRVTATRNLNVRSNPSLLSLILGEQLRGAGGTIVDGPQSGSGYTWWKIDWSSGQDGWSAQDYIQKVAAAEDTVPTNVDTAAALQSASEAVEKANTALLNANNSVTVANGLHILPGTLPGAIPHLNTAIATARRSSLSAVENAQKALSIAQVAHREATLAVQLVGLGNMNAARAATEKATSLAEQSLSFSRVVERFVNVVNLVNRLLNAAVL